MTQRNAKEWIQTYTGRRFWPLEPRAEDVFIEDIAHALSNICRFTGHTLQFYSVGQHSVLCSYAVPESDALWALLHDASEAYLSDFARPVKYHSAFKQAYCAAEDRLQRVIADAFSLGWPMPASVKVADNRLLATERRDLMRTTDLAWSLDAEPLPEIIKPLSPVTVEHYFLERFAELQNQRFASLRSCGLLPKVDHVYSTAV